MWRPEQHSHDENLRWAWLRASEWKHWPLFISQPFIPIFIYFYPWVLVVGLLTLITFAWWIVVAPRFTPTTAIDMSVYFMWLRFVIPPLMAYHIWQNGYPWIAALALFWPLAGNWIVLWLLMLPEAALAFTEGAKTAQIGLIQERLMSRFGYTRRLGKQWIE